MVPIQQRHYLFCQSSKHISQCQTPVFVGGPRQLVQIFSQHPGVSWLFKFDLDFAPKDCFALLSCTLWTHRADKSQATPKMPGLWVREADSPAETIVAISCKSH